MIVQIIITVAILMAVVLWALVARDHLMLVLHIFTSIIAAMILLLWAEMNYGALVASDYPNAAMWGSTVSFALLLVRTLKAAGREEV